MKPLVKRIDRVEQAFVQRGIAQALERARSGPRADFAAVLVRWLPHDGRGNLWMDLELLTDDELLLIKEWQP